MTSDTKKTGFFKMFLLVLKKKKITKANQITKECMVCEGEMQEIELEKGRG